MFMEQISTLFGTFQPVKSYSERADLIQYFTDEINKERVGTKYKPISCRAVAIKVGHLKELHELYYFQSILKDYKNRNGSFSKGFFGMLKVRD